MVKKRRKKKLYDTSAIAASITKQFGDSAVYSKTRKKVKTLSTGSLMLDWICDVGGFPIGRIVEIFGAESTGKTTLSLAALRSIQRRGGIAIYIDAENSWDPVYASEVMKLDIDNIVVLQPDTGEEAFNMAARIIDEIRNIDAIVVLDSVVACIPKVQLEQGFDENSIALQARLISKGIVRIKEVLRGSNSCFVLTNQVREKIGIMWGDPETTAGGRALRHYATIRLQLKRRSWLTEKKKRIGYRLMIRSVKNKIGIPFKYGEEDVLFGKGVDNRKAIIECGVEARIAKRVRGGFEFNGKRVNLNGPYGKVPSLVAREIRKEWRKS